MRHGWPDGGKDAACLEQWNTKECHHDGVNAEFRRVRNILCNSPQSPRMWAFLGQMMTFRRRHSVLMRAVSALALAMLGAACYVPSIDAEETIDMRAAPAPSVVVIRSRLDCYEDTGAPEELACTGLYADFGMKTLGPRVREYEPPVPLWSGGAESRRWIALPEGSTIDASEMGAWVFPMGTKIWKELRYQGRRVETQYLWKRSKRRWSMASYRWDEREASASRLHSRGADSGSEALDGLLGIPSELECEGCHRSGPEPVLGLDALSTSLPGAVGLTLTSLVSEGLLRPAPPGGTEMPLNEGDNKAVAALSWLHVQCGLSCHHLGDGGVGSGLSLNLRLRYDEVRSRPVEEWAPFQSLLNPAPFGPMGEGAARRLVVPGAPDESLLVKAIEGTGELRMPPWGPLHGDADGIQRVRLWIESLAETPMRDRVPLAR